MTKCYLNIPRSLCLLSLLLPPMVANVAQAGEVGPVPLRVYGNTSTIELAPVLLAVEKFSTAPVTITSGGVPDLFKPGAAELATNAETQALRVTVDNPDLRIILTVSEGLYRIVGRRSAGITKLADLKGKRVATIGPTSSGYFLHRMLQTVGLTDSDVTVVPINPLSRMAEALEKREVDAVTIWEPEMQRAIDRIGDDAIEFSGRGVYRELFNLNTTAQQLADPVQRKRIVAFVRSVVVATKSLHADPAEARKLVARSSHYDESTVARTWQHHAYPGTLVPDLLDVLEAEEVWSARERNRTPRTHAQLATLIDASVIKEVLAAEPDLRGVISPPEPPPVKTRP
jgi:sulfonate transport system substrate-binding protein